MESTHSKQDIFIIADDLGLNSAVNEGIFFAFKNGLISGASLMPNGEAFDDAIQRLKYFPGFNVRRAGDDTLYALKGGKVKFAQKKRTRFDGSKRSVKIVNVL